MNYFDYNAGCDLPADAFRISPSQISKFLDSTSEWYRENLLNEAPAFTGSTSSELGTCLHAAAHMYYDTGTVDRKAISDYIASLGPDIDKQLITKQLKPMSECLINQFLAPNKHIISSAEQFISYEIRPGIYVAGTYDADSRHRRTIYDYKSMGSLDTARIPTSFPRNYWFQQQSYAYIKRKLGDPVDNLSLVYVTRENVGRVSEKTGKPLQDYPSECHILTEPVTPESQAIIEGVLNLIAESVQLFKSHPEYRHIIMQDYRYKL